MRSAKLRMQRRDNQTGIQFRDVATQYRLEPGFAGRAIEPVAAVPATLAAIRLQIAQQLYPIALMIFVKRTAARSFNAKPDAIALHYPAHASERQPVETQRLTVSSTNNVDRFGIFSDNLSYSIT